MSPWPHVTWLVRNRWLSLRICTMLPSKFGAESKVTCPTATRQTPRRFPWCPSTLSPFPIASMKTRVWSTTTSAKSLLCGSAQRFWSQEPALTPGWLTTVECVTGWWFQHVNVSSRNSIMINDDPQWNLEFGWFGWGS